jgi:hypothetical protein
METFTATFHHSPKNHSAIITLVDQNGKLVDESVVGVPPTMVTSFFNSESKVLAKLGYIKATMAAINHGGQLTKYQSE